MIVYTAILSDNEKYEISANLDEKIGEYYIPFFHFKEEGDIWDNDDYLIKKLYPFLKGERQDEELEEIIPFDDRKELSDMFEEAIKLKMFG